MIKLIIAFSKVLKRIARHRKYFGYHVAYSGHLVNSCNAIQTAP